MASFMLWPRLSFELDEVVVAATVGAALVCWARTKSLRPWCGRDTYQLLRTFAWGRKLSLSCKIKQNILGAICVRSQ